MSRKYINVSIKIISVSREISVCSEKINIPRKISIYPERNINIFRKDYQSMQKNINIPRKYQYIPDKYHPKPFWLVQFLYSHPGFGLCCGGNGERRIPVTTPAVFTTFGVFLTRTHSSLHNGSSTAWGTAL